MVIKKYILYDVSLFFIFLKGVVHKWRHGLGEGGRKFCDNSAKVSNKKPNLGVVCHKIPVTWRHLWTIPKICATFFLTNMLVKTTCDTFYDTSDVSIRILKHHQGFSTGWCSTTLKTVKIELAFQIQWRPLNVITG